MKLSKLSYQFIVILSTLLIIYSCNSAKQNIERNIDTYKVSYIDSLFFRDYILLYLKNENDKKRLLLSRRVDPNLISSEYKKIKVGENYAINISKIDSTFSVEKNDRFYTTQMLVDEDKQLIWSNDTFRTIIYMSNNIIDGYIKIE